MTAGACCACSTACRPAGGSSSQPGGGSRSTTRSSATRPIPPDPFAGISLRSHNRFLQEAAYLVWRTPRLRAFNQFRLTDGPLRRARGLRRYAEFQSGLLFANRRKKPSYRSFPDPFVIDGSRFWGQVRPGGRHTVRLQYRRGRRPLPDHQARPHRQRRLLPRPRLRRRKGQYRYTYRGPSGASDTLRIR